MKFAKLSRKIIAVSLATCMTASCAVTANAITSSEAKEHTFGVIGNFNECNGWRNDIPMSDDDGDGVYTAEITGQPAGDYEFKVRADSSWYDSWGVYEYDVTNPEIDRTYNSQTSCCVTVWSETDVIKVTFDTTKLSDAALAQGDSYANEITADDEDAYMFWPVSYCVNESFGDNTSYSDFEYSENDDGTITITDYTGNDKELVIPSRIDGKTVTSIGYMAFYECTGLTSVTIPDSVTSIGDSAFEDCTGLKSITIPDGVTEIGSSAFSGTEWYNNQPEGLVYAGKVAYKYKGEIHVNTEITLKDGTKSIAGEAFYNCGSLTSVTIPDSVTSIGKLAFADCRWLTSVTIPDSVTEIGWAAFGGTGLTSVTIPDSVTSIGDEVFAATCLTSVTIPDSVTSIGYDAFYGCTWLTSITIPDSVTSIGSDAFRGTEWYNNQPDGVVYAGKVAYKYKGEIPENTKITLKDGTKGIVNGAFKECTGLTSVTIPDSVTSIGDRAFYNCTGLTSVTIGDSVTSIGNWAFENCTGLTSITIGDSVTSIGDWAFEDCTGLTSVTIPDSVTSIGGYAFANCTELKSVAIPDSVTSIGYKAFGYYNELINGFKIYGVKGSAAEIYANNNNIKFVETIFNNSTISAKTINNGNSITLTGKATGGTSPYQYAFSVKHSTATAWTTIKSYNTTATKTWKPAYTGTYQVCAKVKDSTGKEIKKFFTLTVKAPLTNNSTISKTTINYGDSVTITGVAEGGTSPYQYSFTAYNVLLCATTTIQDYSSNSTVVWTPKNSGVYNVSLKIKDSDETEVIKSVMLVVQLPLDNESTISSTEINKGETVNLKAVATGGTAPYQYAFSVKHSTATSWTTIKSYNTTATKTWKPAYTGTYQVCAKIKDASGTEVDKFFTLTVKAPLTNNSTISATTINKGNSITLTGKATGGTSPYQYAFSVKHSTAIAWTTIKSYSTTDTKVWKPTKTGTYQVCAKVKDSTGKEIKKFFTLTVNEPLINNSTISKTTIKNGDSVTLNAVATGGISPYEYEFTAKHSTETEWTVLKNYNTTSTYTWKPDITGTYQVCAKVKDAIGTEVDKFFTLTVNEPLVNNSTISQTTINNGDSVTLTGVAEGGIAPYQYSFTAYNVLSYETTTIQDYSSNSTVVWTPKNSGVYNISLKIKDADETEVIKSVMLVVQLPLSNESTISKTTITKGDSITLTGKATGGTTPYQYAFYVKHSTATAWTTLKSYSTTATKTWTPAKTGKYSVCAKVKDAKGTEVKKFFTLTINTPLANNSAISKTTITKGDSITLTGKATGGTAPYQYAFTVKHSTATSWTTLKSYSTTATRNWAPAKTGTYQVCAKVKDASGTEIKKFFTLTVK